MIPSRRVFGVDFSGARDAGRRIWVCRAHPGTGGVRVESVDRLADLPGGVVDRKGALRALVQKVLEAPRSAWGMDFPFALPQTVVEEAAGPSADPSWRGQLEAVAALAGPDALRDRCREAAGGRELRRATDQEAATPFSPYNLRLYKQTFYGMTGVLLPLSRHREVAILPQDPLPGASVGRGGCTPAGGGSLVGSPPVGADPGPRPGAPHIYVLEVCPASLLRRMGLEPRGYKGRGEAEVRRRRELLRDFVKAELVRPLPRSLRERIAADPGGDALDAVLAAVAAWRGTREYDHEKLHKDRRYRLEGHVYV